MMKLIIFSILAIQVFAEECPEKKSHKLMKGLKMRCSDGKWTPVESRGGPSGPPCEDDASLSAQGTCSADKGHCSQYTQKGAHMDKDCPGTCDSCDSCRCQDNSQWHKYCPFWDQYCDSPGVLGSWMSQNCRKSCNKCKCGCCSYQGKKHGLNERIPLPEQCGELVCEEGLVAEESQLLDGAAEHNISHPEELTLVFRTLFPGSECCLLPSGGQDRNTREKMVQEGWSGQLSRNGNTLQATCCHGILCVPLKDGIEIKPEQPPASTTKQTTTTATTTASTSTTTTTTTTTTITTEAKSCPSGWNLYESSCYRFYSTARTWTQAQAECQKEGSNLASVPNVGILTFIGGLKGQSIAYLGGSRPAGSNPNVGWEWLGAMAWSYEHWYSNEPNSATQLCLRSYGTQHDNAWDDINCDGQYGYVCETTAKPACVEVDKDFPGNDIGYLGNIGSWEDCNCECKKKSGCTHFTWHAYSSGQCFLKNGRNPQYKKGDLSASVDCYNKCSQGCATGWTSFRSKCYRFYSSAETWNTAQEECKNEGANLASVTDVAINNFFSNLANGESGLIIGGYELTTNKYVWIDGSQWAYTNWDSGEPGGNTEHCAVIRPGNGKWHDYGCDEAVDFPYVCTYSI